MKPISAWLFLPLVFFCTPAATGQPSPFPEAPEDPAVTARLDPLLAAKDWMGLANALAKPVPTNQQELISMVKDMDWLKRKIDNGGNFFLVMSYAGDLWKVSLVNSEKPGVRTNAGAMTLYAVSLIMIDGAACQDQSAPHHRMDQLVSQLAAVLKDMKSRPQNEKLLQVFLATSMERITAPRRAANDEVLCGGGMEEMAAGLERGTQSPPDAQAGFVGKVVTVTPPAEWKPSFLSKATYEPEQKKLREGMTKFLTALIE